MADSIVVDTCVLLHATDNDETGQEFLNCFTIVDRILNDDRISLGVDNNWEIMQEYESNLSGRRDHVAKALKSHIVDQTRKEDADILSYHFPIDDDTVDPLRSMGFHDSDLKFVKVGPASDLQVIVTTDGESFQEEEYKSWIEGNLDVKVLSPGKCIDIINKL